MTVKIKAKFPKIIKKLKSVLKKLQAIYYYQLKMRDPVLLKHHLRKSLNVFTVTGPQNLENILA